MSKNLNVIAGSLTGKLLFKVFSSAVWSELKCLCIYLPCLFSPAAKVAQFFKWKMWYPEGVHAHTQKQYAVCYLMNSQCALGLGSFGQEVQRVLVPWNYIVWFHNFSKDDIQVIFFAFFPLSFQADAWLNVSSLLVLSSQFVSPTHLTQIAQPSCRLSVPVLFVLNWLTGKCKLNRTSSKQPNNRSAFTWRNPLAFTPFTASFPLLGSFWQKGVGLHLKL